MEYGVLENSRAGENQRKKEGEDMGGFEIEDIDFKTT